MNQKEKGDKLQVGDVFCVPLSDGRYAYAHYIYYDDQKGDAVKPAGHGPLIRIFNQVSDEVLPLEKVVSREELFPPVFGGLHAAVKSGAWKKIDHLPVTNFIYPTFRITSGTGPGTYHDWRLWDGHKIIFLGDLPEEDQKLELLMGWTAGMIETRITTGKNPFNQEL